jgi:hypothetical protein
MKKIIGLLLLGVRLGWCGVQAAPATDASGRQLTIELRDGSRVVGQIRADSLGFYSVQFGDRQLAWAAIRTVDYATAADTVRLTTTNGDSLFGQLTVDTLAVTTVFGPVDLPVKQIRSVKVSTPGTAGGHLIGWWKLDDG